MKPLSKLFIFLTLTITVVAAEARTLGIVFIEGLNKKLANTAKEELQTLIPKEFNIADVQNAMERLNKLGTFNGIEAYYDEVESNKTNIVFKFLPIHLIRSISFSGNTSFGNLDLFSELGFSEGDGLTQDKVQSGVDNIKKYYNLNGYLNAQVSADVTPVENSSDVSINIIIEESQPCRMHNIYFRSINDSLNKTLYKSVKKNIGKIFTQSALTQMQTTATAALFDDSYFSANLQAPEMTYNELKTEVNLNYVVSDPYAYALVFEGNQTFNSAKLKSELNITPDNRLSSSPVEDITERLTRFYKKNGYANISIKHSENLFAQDFTRRINLSIQEGAKVKIKNIIFDGNLSRPQNYYQNFMYQHSSDIVESGVFNSDDLDTGVKNLVTELQNQGYLSAKVPSLRTDFDKTRSFATVKISLEEGPRTFISQVIFLGVKNATQAELETTIEMSANQPLQLNKLEDSANKIIEHYRKKGYLDVQLSAKDKSLITYSADNSRATLTFDISEGPLITVSAILVEGNTFTKDYVVVRELQFHQGEVLTPDKLSYSELRLQRLSIFTAIDIRTLEDDPRNGNRTVLVHVTEHDPGVFQSGVGVNNDLTITVKGFIGTAYRNLFGTGRGINARVEVDEKLPGNKLKGYFPEYDLNFGYTEPFIFGFTGTGHLDLTRSNKIYSVDPAANQIIANDNMSGSLKYEKDLSRNIKLIYETYGLTRTATYEIYGQNVSATTGQVINDAPLLIATTGPTIKFDGRDNIYNPTRGYNSTLSFEFSSPYMGSTQTVSYYRTVDDFTRYIPLGRVVLATQAKAGYVKNLSTLSDGFVPQIKTFFLGGQSTIRGFSPSEAFPLSQTDVPNGVPTEEYFLLEKSELRFPISGNLGGALFYDGGKVAFPGYHSQFPWRDSVGAGIRYITPVGPVSLEFGWKLNQDNTRGESPYAIQFSIGVF